MQVLIHTSALFKRCFDTSLKEERDLDKTHWKLKVTAEELRRWRNRGMAVPCAHPNVRKSPGSTLADVLEPCPKWVRALSLSTEFTALGNLRVFHQRKVLTRKSHLQAQVLLSLVNAFFIWMEKKKQNQTFSLISLTLVCFHRKQRLSSWRIWLHIWV